MREKKVFDASNIVDMGDVELTEEQDKVINAMIEQADKEIEEMRMQIRWNKQQIDVIKKAAFLIGIPYQTYVKNNIFIKAIDDIERIERNLAKV